MPNDWTMMLIRDIFRSPLIKIVYCPFTLSLDVLWENIELYLTDITKQHFVASEFRLI